MIHRAAVVSSGLLLAGVLAACATLAGADPLDGTSWQLVSIDGETPLPGRPITLTFEHGEIRGSSGCNTYFGTYEVRGDSLTVAELMWTEMACVEPGWMEQESAYLSRLAAANGFALSEGRLELPAGETPTLVFDAQP